MKKIVITLITAGTLAGGGCHTNKLLSRQSDRTGSYHQESHKSLSQHQQTLLNRNDRIDSGVHEFSISILEADSFHFSPTEGFSGAAARIVLRGRSTGTLRSSSTSAATSSTGNSNISSNTRKVESEKSGKVRTVEARTFNTAFLTWCAVIVLLGFLARYLYRRVKINHVINP